MVRDLVTIEFRSLISRYRPGDNPNQCALGYNCPPPTLTLDSFVPFGNRYIDIGAGGPASFAFSLTSNVTWLHLSSTKGSITPSSPEQRVFASVDWSAVTGVQNAIITITATAAGQPSSSQAVYLVANHTVAPSDFKGTCFRLEQQQWPLLMVVNHEGFVEGDGGVSIEAAHASRNTSVDGLSWVELPGYGRTLSAITPWPRGGDERNFTVGTGPSMYVLICDHIQLAYPCTANTTSTPSIPSRMAGTLL